MKQSVTVKSPINIALVKYWGKSNEDIIIPCNGSISATVDTDSIYTTTVISFSETQAKDTFKLNGKEDVLSSRMIRVLSIVGSIIGF